MTARATIPASKRFRLTVAAGALAGAVLIGASLLSVVASSGAPSRLTHVAEITTLLDGIPQQGTALGRADAPVTLVEYEDMQCPYCGRWSRNAIPTLIRRYVRSGKLRIEFRGIAFIGPDSVKALRFVEAAAAQNRAWQALELTYENQGAENWGWVTGSYLRLLAAAAGLRYEQASAYAASPSATASMKATARQAAADKVDSTPTVLVGPTGGQLSPVGLRSLEASEVVPAIEKALRAGS